VPQFPGRKTDRQTDRWDWVTILLYQGSILTDVDNSLFEAMLPHVPQFPGRRTDGQTDRQTDGTGSQYCCIKAQY